MSSGTLYLGENAVSPSVASALVKYSAGDNVQITNDLVISATDTKYTAGKNVTIDANNTISTKSYTAGVGIEVTENGVINATTVQFPDTTGHELSFLMTDGENVSWEKLAIFNLLDRKESDHILNDVRWLRADTFSWQDSELYPTIYEHLANEYGANISSSVIVGAQYRTPERDKVVNGVTYYCWDNMYTTTETPAYGDSFYAMSGGSLVGIPNYPVLTNDTLKTDTFGDIAITYFLAEDGHKICFPDQEEQIIALYETSKSADYFILDFTNKRFKLPRKNKRKITHTYKQGSNWYNSYSDGWVEQGGTTTVAGAQYAQQMISLLVPMSDKNYSVSAIATYPGAGDTTLTVKIDSSLNTTTQVAIRKNWSSATGEICWIVSGYAAKETIWSPNEVFEYYYVGEYQKTSLEQIAGINAEQFNTKVDTGHEVVAFQRPTSDNDYTWYRKYADGWVEQGGTIQLNVSSVTLPVELIDANYTCIIMYRNTTSTTNIPFGSAYTNSQTTTGFTCVASTATVKGWQISYMAA